jgi:ligand-binding sensor domain-containing protein/two-component sensor histidine kinase
MRLCARSFLFLVAITATLSAEKLPIRAYTTADGLPHNTIMRIAPDSHGFLWFCTLRGLARFDGYSFKSYGAAQGLRGIVSDLLETRGGEYWVGTLNGLYRFHTVPSGWPMFEPYRMPDGRSIPGVNTLHEDRNGVIWAATNAGLYRLLPTDGRRVAQLVDLAVPGKAADTVRVFDLLEARDGAMWISLPQAGVRRLTGDHEMDIYTTLGLPGGLAGQDAFRGAVRSMLEDRESRIWLASGLGLSVLERQTDSSRFERIRTYTAKDGFRDSDPRVLLEAPDGRLWVGGSTALMQLCPASVCGKDTIVSYSNTSLRRDGAVTLSFDHDGNLWIGTETGALRLARNGFTTYDDMDGLGSSRVYWVSANAAGNLSVVTHGTHGAEIGEFDGHRFHSVVPHLPVAGAAVPGPQRASGLQDIAGDWWVSTDRGLCHFPRVAKAEELANIAPKAVYTSANGLPAAEIISLFADSRGDLWVGSIDTSAATGILSQWQRRTRSFHRHGAAEGLTTSTAPLAFAEDRAGDLWVGFQYHDLARYHEGRFRVFTVHDGLPPGSIWSLYLDRRGSLWVATTEGGVARLDHPEAEHLNFAAYTTANGLSSDQIQAITEDRWGRIYLLTDRGVDRLDPDTGWIKHYTSADGLVGSSHWGTAFRDRAGDLWFGTLEGLSRFTPKEDEPATPPAIRITGIRVRGDSYPVSELGQTVVAPLLLRPALNQVQIDFASLNFSVGEALRYQYKLEGADSDWSRISDQRTVNYATLSPGMYRFQVRAVNWKGTVSVEPAALEFRILAPFWQRWWFLTLLAVAAASLVYWLHRIRVVRLLELERIRSRIATDLHDDIGASLSQIAVLSEVVRMELARGENHGEQPLMRIASVSRELVDSMSEIVWSVNPQKDRLRDLAQHAREFAEDVFVNRNIVFEFRGGGAARDLKLGMEARRQVFLVFKECVNNIARHSGCSRVEANLETEGDWLVLRVADNGHGFDPVASDIRLPSAHGHGLESMRSRARNLGGNLDVQTGCDRGVTVTLRVPLKTARSNGRVDPSFARD